MGKVWAAEQAHRVENSSSGLQASPPERGGPLRSRVREQGLLRLLSPVSEVIVFVHRVLP